MKAQRHADRWRTYGEKASEALKSARPVIEKCEWAGRDDHDIYCIICDNNMSDGHKTNCAIAIWLKKYPALTSKNVEGEE
jgi:hypothetical protein